MTDPADVLVIFGITSDLAKKMTFQALYRLERRGLLDCPIVGVASRPRRIEEIREIACHSIEEAGETVEPKIFERLANRLSYVGGNFSEGETYQRLAAATKGARRPLFYLEIPPNLFSPVVHGLSEAGLCDNASIVIEKPFGHDLASARSLADDLHHYLDESQIYRVDHFLGKMGLDELVYLRFANAIIEPIWNRNYVQSVQITLAESLGVESRGHFYDPVGALRDVVANHLMQVVAAAAMEAPAGHDTDTIKNQQTALWRAMPPADPAHYVRGQYDGYRDIDGVAPDSTTETFAALRLDVENWRWSGVPFFLRTGKRLPLSHTEIRLIFREPPRLNFLARTGHRAEPDELVVRFDPSVGIRLMLSAERSDKPGPEPITLDVEFAQEGGEGPTPYEVLLWAALTGDSSRFTRQDGVEQQWRVMQPLLDHPPDVLAYQPGSWGPAAADSLVRGHSSWRAPWGST